MGPEIDIGKRLNVKMEVTSYTSNDNFAKELEDELMKFTTTYDDPKVEAPFVEQAKEDRNNADDQVDIMECKRSGGNDLVGEVLCRDTTESSSSFGNSSSDDDNLGDDALSNFHVDVESIQDVQREMFRTRRKKLTAHWRSFIQPLMWRCKWTELQIKKYESQAEKYDRKLAEYSQQKHIQSSVSEGSCAKSLSFSSENSTNKVLERKRRRRTETMKDLAAHMSNHSLFSYYEIGKNITEAAFMYKAKIPAKIGQNLKIDENSWVNDELFWAYPGDGDDSIESLLDKILSLEWQVGKMRNRAGRVITDNAATFSYLENLSLPLPNTASMGSPQDPPPPHFIMSESAAASHAKVVSDVNGGKNLARFADELIKVEDEGVDNQRVKQEINDFEVVRGQPIERPVVVNDGAVGSSDPLMEESDLSGEGQTPSKLRSMAKITAPAKTKGKRGRRKCAGRGGPRSSY